MMAHLASGIRPQAAYAFSLDLPLPTGTRDLPPHWSGWKRRHWTAEVIRPGLLLYGFDKSTRTLSVLLKVTRGGPFTYRSLSEFSRRVRELTGTAPSTEIGATPPCTSVKAIENTKTEVVAYRRGRSRALREAVLERSAGICAVCRRNFSRVAGGLGRSALQVHHRKQLAASDRPVLTSPGDLAVVCANCHMMIHSDSRRTLTIHQLRRRLAT